MYISRVRPFTWKSIFPPLIVKAAAFSAPSDLPVSDGEVPRHVEVGGRRCDDGLELPPPTLLEHDPAGVAQWRHRPVKDQPHAIPNGARRVGC